jgi:hypothetical protein
MAKRKKAKKTSGRRRRVSGVNTAGLQRAAMVVAGFAAGKLASNAIDSFTKSKPLDPKIKGAILFVAGQFLVPKVLKSQLGQDLGLGMSVAGGSALLSALGIKGLGATQRYLPGISAQVNGAGVKQSINGINTRIVALAS